MIIAFTIVSSLCTLAYITWDILNEQPVPVAQDTVKPRVDNSPEAKTARLAQRQAEERALEVRIIQQLKNHKNKLEVVDICRQSKWIRIKCGTVVSSMTYTKLNEFCKRNAIKLHFFNDHEASKYGRLANY